MVSRKLVEVVLSLSVKTEISPQYEANCGLINTVNVEHKRKEKKRKEKKRKEKKRKEKKRKEKARNSVQATTNATLLLTTANGKNMRNESEKAKIFQINEVSPGFSFCLFSAWLHQTMTYLVHIHMVSFTHKYIYTHYMFGR